MFSSSTIAKAKGFLLNKTAIILALSLALNANQAKASFGDDEIWVQVVLDGNEQPIEIIEVTGESFPFDRVYSEMWSSAMEFMVSAVIAGATPNAAGGGSQTQSATQVQAAHLSRAREELKKGKDLVAKAYENVLNAQRSSTAAQAAHFATLASADALRAIPELNKAKQSFVAYYNAGGAHGTLADNEYFSIDNSLKLANQIINSARVLPSLKMMDSQLVYELYAINIDLINSFEATLNNQPAPSTGPDCGIVGLGDCP